MVMKTKGGEERSLSPSKYIMSKPGQRSDDLFIEVERIDVEGTIGWKGVFGGHRYCTVIYSFRLTFWDI